MSDYWQKLYPLMSEDQCKADLTIDSENDDVTNWNALFDACSGDRLRLVRQFLVGKVQVPISSLYPHRYVREESKVLDYLHYQMCKDGVRVADFFSKVYVVKTPHDLNGCNRCMPETGRETGQDIESAADRNQRIRSCREAGKQYALLSGNNRRIILQNTHDSIEDYVEYAYKFDCFRNDEYYYMEADEFDSSLPEKGVAFLVFEGNLRERRSRRFG